MIPKLFEDSDAAITSPRLEPPAAPTSTPLGQSMPATTAAAMQPAVPRGLFDDGPMATQSAPSAEPVAAASAPQGFDGGLCGLFGESVVRAECVEQKQVDARAIGTPQPVEAALVNLMGPVIAEVVAEPAGPRAESQPKRAWSAAKPLRSWAASARRRPYLSGGVALLLLVCSTAGVVAMMDDEVELDTVVAAAGPAKDKPAIVEPAKTTPVVPPTTPPKTSSDTPATTPKPVEPSKAPMSTVPTQNPPVAPQPAPPTGNVPANVPPSNAGQTGPSTSPIPAPPPGPTSNSPTKITLDRADGKYRHGETLSLRCTSERAGFVYVFYRQADGSTRMLFPNRASSNNQIAAGATLEIGAPGSAFRIRIGAPFGEEELLVAVVDKPIASGVDVRSGQVTPDFLAELNKTRTANPASIGLASIALHTSAAEGVARK